MRAVLIGLCLVLLTTGTFADESSPDKPVSGGSVPEDRGITDSGSQVVEPPASSAEKTDAEIRQIEKTVSGNKDIEEFKPTSPLSADKAIALPSDI